MSVKKADLGFTLRQVRLMLEEEIARLQRKLSILSDDEAPKRVYNKTAPKKQRRTMSAKGRKAISAAMKARWAAKKKPSPKTS